MDAQGGHEEVNSASFPHEGLQRDDDGPPRTPWRVAVFLTSVISAFSWMFKTWDNSEFPDESFLNPLYWSFLCIILLFAAIWAFVIRNRNSRIDKAMIIGLLLTAVGALVNSVLVAREAMPPEHTYTAVVFQFSGDDDMTRNAAGRFRGAILRELENVRQHNPKQFLLRDRPREIKGKGETLDEKLAYARRWASRRRGGHLAIWIELGLEKDGQNYSGTVYFVKVSPFEKEVNADTMNSFGPSGWWSRSFRMSPVGPERSVGESEVQDIVRSILFNWGLQSYQKGDYDTALRLLPGALTSLSQFYAGEAAYNKALGAVDSTQLLRDAENYYRRAIDIVGSEDSLAAAFYSALGRTYLAYVRGEHGSDLIEKAYKAISAFRKSAEIYAQLNRLEARAFQLRMEAEAFYDLWTLDTSAGAAADLNRAEMLLNDAFAQLKRDFHQYFLARNLLGRIYYAQKEYEKAVDVFKESLQFFTKAGDSYYVASTLRFLGEAQTKEGMLRKNQSEYDEGVSNLEKASRLCQGHSVDMCYNALMDAGNAALFWAGRWRRGSAPWSANLERALENFRSAESFISRKEQPERYARLKRFMAAAYTEEAIGEVVKAGEPMPFLSAALAQLSEAVEAMTQSGRNPEKLYQLFRDRAKCYQRMSAYSDNLQEHDNYRRLAQQDDARAKKRSP